MTVLSRGARSRRGGRRPGWLLLTALLVLAIAASSALVFTNRVELLKLAVIVALWAAVVAAFASVIYRRQSEADAAKARDLKLVYDLQLDREISARREYELTVEAQLRRELASELRTQSADEVAALRAELAALRNNLEILFETELAQRPAIETERTTVRAYSDWERETEITGRRGSASRFREEAVDTGENRIIDVPEEPLARRYPGEEPVGARYPGEEPLGARYPGEEPLGARYPGEEPVAGRYSAEPPEPEAEPVRRRHAMDYAEGVAAHRLPSEHGTWASPHQEQEPVAPEPVARAGAPPEADWEPVSAEGHWRPAGTPGSNWASSGNGFSTAPEPAQALVPEPSPGRHASPSGEAATAEEEPSAHHRIPAEAPTSNSAHAEGQGQSVAELLARLQATESGGGRRRRREN